MEQTIQQALKNAPVLAIFAVSILCLVLYFLRYMATVSADHREERKMDRDKHERAMTDIVERYEKVVERQDRIFEKLMGRIE